MDQKKLINVFKYVKNNKYKLNKTGWSKNTIVRFFSKINIPNNFKEDCWFWTAAKTNGGYGIFRVKGKNKRAHRLMYEFFYGEIPKDIHILHKCDIPKCVSPFHLWKGTHLDNVQDKVNKNRTVKLIGEHHGACKHDLKKIYNILKQIENGEIKNKQDLQNKIKDIQYQYIMRILNGKIRKDVGDLFDLQKLKNQFCGRFTNDQIKEIRNCLQNGETGNSISKRFNCNESTISYIKNKKFYNHVK
jgi:hypothetical protein